MLWQQKQASTAGPSRILITPEVPAAIAEPVPLQSSVPPPLLAAASVPCTRAASASPSDCAAGGSGGGGLASGPASGCGTASSCFASGKEQVRPGERAGLPLVDAGGVYTCLMTPVQRSTIDAGDVLRRSHHIN